MNLSAIHNVRFPIYNRSKPRFNILETLRWLNHKDKPLISTALYQERCGLYNIADYRYRKIYSIEEVAVEPKLIPSLYQRCYVKNIKNVMRYH